MDFNEEMRNIYYDENNYVGIHGTAVSDYEKIFSEGLIFTREDAFSNTKDDLKFILKDKADLSFEQFSSYVYKPMVEEYVYIVIIPKDELISDLWVRNNETPYLNPKYIYGCYLSHNMGQFNENKEIIHNERYLDRAKKL